MAFENNQLLRLLKNEYEKGVDKSRNIKYIRKFFDMSRKNEYTLDDQTWNDLDIDRVFEKIDRTYSSPGESALYCMLRNPLMEEEKLKGRNRYIELFKNDIKLRGNLQSIFTNLGRDRKNSFLEMVENKLLINKLKYYIYTLFGKALPVLFILGAIFINVKFMLALFGLSFLNMFINSTERNMIKSNGILYLRSIIRTAKKISNIKNKEVASYVDNISSILERIKGIDRSLKFVGFANMWGGLLEFVSVIFLLEETGYYAASQKINEEKQTLMDLYYEIGELEALISVSGYQYGLQQYVNPKFIKEITLSISDGVHPLLEEPVPNSINIKNIGIVLTGTNMSGKSTFLRMLGINILLSQTFYFALAKDYEASFFNIISSISPSDDLAKGKSFFMAEAESLLRIIKASEGGIPVFCPIDEIFRGTNPIERISMSAQILKYLNERKTISIVATHDRELVEILKKDYEFYYFSERVDSDTGLSFDYKIKKGVSQSRNAIKLLDYINYPKEIVEKSFKLAESIEGFI